MKHKYRWILVAVAVVAGGSAMMVRSLEAWRLARPAQAIARSDGEAKGVNERILDLRGKVRDASNGWQIRDIDSFIDVAAETVDSVVRGDTNALHELAARRGAVLSDARLRVLRASLADRPPQFVPPNWQSMSDAAVVEESLRKVKPLVSFASDGITVKDVGISPLASPIAAFSVRQPGTISRRLMFPSSSAMFTTFLHVSQETERLGESASFPTVVLEFEGRAEAGPVLIGVAFANSPDCGWLPSAIMVAGGPIAIPR